MNNGSAVKLNLGTLYELFGKWQLETGIACRVPNNSDFHVLAENQPIQLLINQKEAFQGGETENPNQYQSANLNSGNQEVQEHPIQAADASKPIPNQTLSPNNVSITMKENRASDADLPSHEEAAIFV